MNDEAQQSGSGPINIDDVKKKVVITEILGRLKAEGVSVADTKGRENSTRWVFDVVCHKRGSFVVQLVRHLDGRDFKTDIEPSFHFTALSAAFHDAKVYGNTKGSELTIHVDGPCAFRVDMDAIGSNRR
jgi:hypothetical protein